MRLEQVVAGEVGDDRLLRIAVIHDQVHELKNLTVLDDAPEQVLEYLVINTGEVLADVALDEVTMPPHQHLKPVRCRVRALVLPAGEARRVHVPVEDRFQDVHQSVMDHPVPIRGGRD